MFWKFNVSISEKMYQTSGAVMYISRYLGCFPVRVRKYKTTLYLEWSPLHALYSFVFGIAVIALTYDGFMTDVYIGKEKSIRNRSQTEMFVTFMDIFVVSSSVFCGIFVVPLKFATFCKYVDCFNEIDSKIPPKNTKYSRYLPTLLTFSVLFILLILQIGETVMYTVNNNVDGDLYFVLRCYIPYHICYHLMLLTVCLFWYLVYCILKRVKLLNNCLKIENFINPTIKEIAINVTPANVDLNDRVVELPKQDTKLDNDIIHMLIIVYGKLCDAAELLNNLVGINCVVLLIGCLFHLIITFYALIVEILGPRDDPFSTIMMLTWTGTHMIRLLFITEPCYCCLVQVQKTKELVGILLASTEVDNQYKSQLRDFALILQIRNLRFTAAGLVVIDRMLITAMLGAITTYLVIVIQFTTAS